MRTQFIAVSILLVIAAIATVQSLQQSYRATLEIELGRGWTEPTASDHSLLRNYGSRIKKVYLNLRGLRRLVSDHRNGVPGAPPPPDGKLVRVPGKGVHAQRYAEPGDANMGEELVNFPRRIDNSELPCFPPIFNQGPLNSCTSVAVTYYQLTHMTGLARGWDQKHATTAMRFSPMWTFNLINNGNNLGAFQARAYAALMSHGAATLEELPYQSAVSPATNYRRWPSDPKIWQNALTARVENFGVIQEMNVVTFLRRIKLLLVNGHVLTAATAIDAWNQERILDNPASRLDQSYVGEYIATVIGRNSGNHCITIVGYNDDLWVDLNENGIVDAGEKGALKIANSWGITDWNRGFRWLHYSALFGPRSADEENQRQPGLFANQAFWMSPARDYEPALVMQVDLPALYRNEFSLAAGVGPAVKPPPRAQAPNFAFNYNGGRFGFDGKDSPETVRAVLDLTGPAKHFLDQDPNFFVRVARQNLTPVVPRARVVEIATGAVHELTLTPDPATKSYIASAPTLPSLQVGALSINAPAQVDVPKNGPILIPIEVKGVAALGGNFEVKVFSCTASVLATRDISVEKKAGGDAYVRITPPTHGIGSCVLSLQANAGDQTASSSIRINLTDTNAATPTLSIGKTQRQNLQVSVPFKVNVTTGTPEDVIVFFDTSNIDQIGSYKISGTGAERVLTIDLRFWAPFELSLSALDGHYVGSSRVKIDS